MVNVEKGHSFWGIAPVPGNVVSYGRQQGRKGGPRAHLVALLMVPPPVPCDLGTQTPQGPRAPLGPHSTGYEQDASSYSPTASGQVLAQGELKPPFLQKAECSLFTNLWGAITASHSTAGLHGSMPTPRFWAESGQSCRGHHPC